ncbi:GNAT family N-acetyltransferase [Listeria grandensis]|uniref:GNAT family N-acetyltransferase n=1 Tax=Listeria grandensis TaxID=1494963 RepID=A0A7X0Y3W1_9LIST|nr:GNAT family N-acetyltransferase [Listeria grandensis]MBC1935927.1 GNAT family N-acetyltransferase [Listeria grandensis]
MAIRITSQEEADIPALWEIEKSVMIKGTTPHIVKENEYEQFKQDIMAQQMLVAKDEDGVVLGSLIYHYPGSSVTRKRQWLFGISVSKAAQGKGVGKKLISSLFELGKENGIGKIAMRVMATNTSAIAFYKHLGFEQEAYFKREFWIDGEWVDDCQFAYYLD